MHDWRALGNKFTLWRPLALVNGCFDILHAGHVGLFKVARQHGRCLIVALDTDDRIRLLKGPSRPACRLADRAAVVEACRYVDFVTSFTSVLDYREMLTALKPDVLIKGEEYRVQEIIGADLVPRIVFAPQTHSSSALLNRLDSASATVGAG